MMYLLPWVCAIEQAVHRGYGIFNGLSAARAYLAFC